MSRQRALAVGHQLEALHRQPGSAPSPEMAQAESEFWKLVEGLTDEEDPGLHLRNLAARRPSPASHHTIVCANIAIERSLSRSLTDDRLIEDVSASKPVSASDLSQVALILDNLRSAFNIGSVLRTANCLGVGEVWRTGYTADFQHPAVVRAALGAEQAYSTPRSFARVEDAIAQARSEGRAIVALETSASAESIETFVWQSHTALIVGNERFGLDPALLEHCDHIVSIPMFGQKSSFNVAVAAALALQACLNSIASKEKAILRPVGWIRSPAKQRAARPKQGVEQSQPTPVELHLDRSWIDPQALIDLEGFERVWLIGQFHRNLDAFGCAKWRPMVRPPLGSDRKRGVFATRSPHRPNGLSLSNVKLLGVKMDRLILDECDLLDGTPVFDIKPYLPRSDSFPAARIGWATQIANEPRYLIRWLPWAQMQLQWLEGQGLTELRLSAETQLSANPRDSKRKRIVLSENRADALRGVLATGTWRVEFSWTAEDSHIEVVAIRSGYTEQELLSADDPYQDKLTHRRFIEHCAKLKA